VRLLSFESELFISLRLSNKAPEVFELARFFKFIILHLCYGIVGDIVSSPQISRCKTR